MGRTNVVLEDELVARAMELTGARTKREVIHEALRRLVENAERDRLRRRRYERTCKGLLGLEGVGWQGRLEEMRRDRELDLDGGRSRS